MGGDGKCVSMPGQRVRPTIKSFPIVERYGFVWVWPGEKSEADPAKLHRAALGREPRVDVCRRPFPRQVRLPPDDRQPDGPHARDLRARHEHRPARDRGSGAGDARRGRFVDHQPLHEQHRGAAVLARGAARQPPRRRRAGRPLADLPLHAAEPRDDRGRRRPRRPRRLRGAGRSQGLEHRRRLHHARERRLDLVLLGHGAQLQRRRQGAHRDHPRRPGARSSARTSASSRRSREISPSSRAAT